MASTIALAGNLSTYLRRTLRIAATYLTSPRPTRRVTASYIAQWEVRRRLAGYLDTPPDLDLDFSSDFDCYFDGTIARTPKGFSVRTAEISSHHNWQQVAALGSAFMYWLSKCPPEVKVMNVSFCDGDHPSEARFCGSTNLPHITPLPDAYFFQHRGFIAWRRLSETSPTDWHARSNEIVWRGLTTGIGSSDPVTAAHHPHLATDRVLLCLALRDVAGTDVRFSGLRTDRISRRYLERRGLFGEPIAEQSWAGRKFALDVDGNSNTWSNLIIRLHLGCCVLKVASRHGFRQWYYDRLKPWEHYVPVAADLSDLMERIEWVRTHDREAEEIARRGQAFARTLTWEAVEAEAVELITANWNRPQLG